MRFTGRIFSHYREDDFSRVQVFDTVFARYQLALRREDGRDADQVLSSDSRVAQRQLERGEALAVFPDPGLVEVPGAVAPPPPPHAITTRESAIQVILEIIAAPVRGHQPLRSGVPGA